jgi:hypothetical protein
VRFINHFAGQELSAHRRPEQQYPPEPFNNKKVYTSGMFLIFVSNIAGRPVRYFVVLAYRCSYLHAELLSHLSIPLGRSSTQELISYIYL